MIGAGRIHCFRKMDLTELPETDAHYRLRKELLERRPDLKYEPFMSVAYDWQVDEFGCYWADAAGVQSNPVVCHRMFLGVTARGINRELLAQFESGLISRQRGGQALAMAQTGTWCLALHLVHLITQGSTTLTKQEKDQCRGILPALRYLVQQEFGNPSGDHVSTEIERSMEALTLLVNQNVNSTDIPRPRPYCDKCEYELGNILYSYEDSHLCRLCYSKIPKKERKNYKSHCRLVGEQTAWHLLQMLEKEVGIEEVPYSLESTTRLLLAEERLSQTGGKRRIKKLLETCDAVVAADRRSTQGFSHDEDSDEEMNMAAPTRAVTDVRSPSPAPHGAVSHVPASQQSAVSGEASATNKRRLIDSTQGWQGPTNMLMNTTGSALQWSWHPMMFPFGPVNQSMAWQTGQVLGTLPRGQVNQSVTWQTGQSDGKPITPWAGKPLPIPTLQDRGVCRQECSRCGFPKKCHPGNLNNSAAGKKCKQRSCLACKRSWEDHVRKWKTAHPHEEFKEHLPEGGLAEIIGHGCVFEKKMPAYDGSRRWVSS
jgi:hypothetical protein